VTITVVVLCHHFQETACSLVTNYDVPASGVNYAGTRMELLVNCDLRIKCHRSTVLWLII